MNKSTILLTRTTRVLALTAGVAALDAEHSGGRR